MTSPDRRTPDRALIKSVVQETFLLLGVDAKDPLENQKDFAWVRETRQGSERWAIKTKFIMFGTACAGVVSMIVWVVKSAFIGD